MSYRATNWAYEMPISGSAKGVLVALADMADEQDSCFPGQARLSEMTGRSQKTVQRSLAQLESLGLLKRVPRYGKNGWRTSDRYQLNLDVVTIDLPDTVTTSQSDHKSDRLVVNESSLTDIVSSTTGQGDRAEENHQYEPLVEPLEAKSRKKPAIRLPDAWSPNDSSRAFARKNKIDINHEIEQFRAHAAANDRKRADWNAAFRLWLGNVVKWSKPAGAPLVDPNAWMNE